MLGDAGDQLRSGSIHVDDHRSTGRFACPHGLVFHEPFLGLMLTLGTVATLCQMASEMGIAHSHQGGGAYRADFRSKHWDEAHSSRALSGLVGLAWTRPILLPRLAPLIQQEITIRFVGGFPHGAQLQRLVAYRIAEAKQIAKAVAWLKQKLRTDTARPDRKLAARAQHEARLHFRAAFPQHHRHQPIAVPETAAPAGGHAS